MVRDLLVVGFSFIFFLQSPAFCVYGNRFGGGLGQKKSELLKQNEDLRKILGGAEQRIGREKENCFQLSYKVSVLDNQILQVKQQIQRLEKEKILSQEKIVDLEREKNDAIEKLKMRIKSAYFSGDGDLLFLSFLLTRTAGDVDIGDNIAAIKYMAERDRNLMSNTRGLVEQLKAEIDAFIGKEQIVKDLNESLLVQKEFLKELKNNSENSVKSFNEEQQALEKSINKNEAEQKKIDDEIKQCIIAETEKQEKERIIQEEKAEKERKAAEEGQRKATEKKRIYEEQKLTRERREEEKRKEEERRAAEKKKTEEEKRLTQERRIAQEKKAASGPRETVLNGFVSQNSKPRQKKVAPSKTPSPSPTNSQVSQQEQKTYRWPVKEEYNYISSVFNEKRPGGLHKGVDIAGNGIGGEPVFAVADGVVVKVYRNCIHNYGKNGSCGCNGGYGNFVIVRLDDGHTVVYAHLSTVCVDVDARVVQGQVLGLVGSTGFSTGSHLHFELRNKNGECVDPKIKYENIY
jgi:murein DD-endopeptidase MepM/ murein hydrolase activator NlpD